MQTEVLRVLRAKARSWWRHRELRRTGDIDAAHRLERQTISRDIGYLRAALNNPMPMSAAVGEGSFFTSG
tara:strand:+ start:5684 stop:5893 length:210 start_codon:yes stop_codon:yes gene_type:complete